MVEIYDSHEQSERVKRWLRENGGAMALGLVLAFGGLYGFKQWQLWRQSLSQQASAEYHVMVDLLRAGNLDAAVENYETLKSDYGNSSYSALAALFMADARIDAGQPDLAVPMLEYAMEQAKPSALRTIARERLVRVKLDLGDPDAALALLDDAPETTGFEAQFAELRGDILRARGEPVAAVEHYRRALSLYDEGVGDRVYLQMKIDTLAAADPASGDPS